MKTENIDNNFIPQPNFNKKNRDEFMKEEHSKNAIFMWYLLGVIFLILGKFHNFIGIVLYFGVGMFIASFASIITYLLSYPIFFVAAFFHGIPSVVFIFHILMWIIEIVWDIVVAVSVVNFLNRLF